MTLRRANRQIEVFDISLMAVVTKAMGAFLVIMLLLLPYYKGIPPSITSPAEAQKAVDDARRQVAQITQNIGRFTEDPTALRRQLAAAQTALDKANAAIHDLKTALDQTWSQLTRAQRDLTQSRQQLAQMQQQLKQARAQLADAKDTVQLDVRIINALQAQLKARPATVSTKTRPLAVLDTFTSFCQDLGLLPLANFVPANKSQDSSESVDVIPLRWLVSGILSTKILNHPSRTLLHMPGGLGTDYVTVTTDRAPATGCRVYGQLSVIIADEAKSGGRDATETQSAALSKEIPNTGPILLAVVERTEKALAVREPTQADIAAWTESMGGHVPKQPKPPPAVTKGPFGSGVFGPHPTGQALQRAQQEQQERVRQEMQKHLLVRTPSGPLHPHGGPPLHTPQQSQQHPTPEEK